MFVLCLGNNNSLGLMLGLTLGLGVGVLSIIISGTAYYFRVVKPKHKVTTSGIILKTEIPMAPVTNSTIHHTTVSALVT